MASSIRQRQEGFNQTAILFSLISLISACQHAPRPNVLIVTFDTTRADYIGSYGNAKIRTPALDQLAQAGVLFERALAPVPITLPSHTSLMTGKVPFTHGIRDNGLFVLADEQTTLAEILRQNGYHTAAAIGAYPLSAQFGLNQGFELFDEHLTASYEDLSGERVFPKQRLFFDERKAARVNEAILPWLEEHHQQPFFVWLHYFDPHHPHEPPPPYNHLYAHDLYAGEIAYADESLGTVLDQLKRLGVYDRTLIVFTSDHGEGRGEHNESTHSLLAYNATLHVPLIIKPPQSLTTAKLGQRIAHWVGLVDVLPTVLDLLDLPIPDDIQGVSLRPELEGETAAGTKHRPLYAETLSPRLSRNWGELRALVVDNYKYIHGPRPELYHLADDPHEIHDVLAEQPERTAQLRQALEAYLTEHAVAGLDSSVEIDPATIERLRALGYIQGSSEPVGPIDEVLRDDGDPPQDHAGRSSMYSHAKNLLFQRRGLEAREFIRELLKSDPDNAHYLELLVNAELQLGHSDEALAILNQLEQLDRLTDSPAAYPPLEKTLGDRRWYSRQPGRTRRRVRKIPGRRGDQRNRPGSVPAGQNSRAAQPVGRDLPFSEHRPQARSWLCPGSARPGRMARPTRRAGHG